MRKQTTETQPRRKARIAGVFYVLTIVAGMFAALVQGRLRVYGDAANLVATACYLIVTLLFYQLFKPVNRPLSLLAAFCSLVGCAFGALEAFHVVLFRINNLVFFGFYCLLIGILILKSSFLPRLLGVLMALTGLGWLTFISPPLAHSLSPYVMVLGLIGEGSLTVWLLVVGVNSQRWRELAGAAGMTGSGLETPRVAG